MLLFLHLLYQFILLQNQCSSSNTSVRHFAKASRFIRSKIMVSRNCQILPAFCFCRLMRRTMKHSHSVIGTHATVTGTDISKIVQFQSGKAVHFFFQKQFQIFSDCGSAAPWTVLLSPGSYPHGIHKMHHAGDDPMLLGALSQLLPESILFRCHSSPLPRIRGSCKKYLPHQFGVFRCQSCCHRTTGTAASYKHTRALVCFSIALTCATFINLIFFSLARGCTTSVTLQSLLLPGTARLQPSVSAPTE